MTIKELNDLIDLAIKDSHVIPGAMPQTNVLNAEYAAGQVYAYLHIIQREYGIDEYVKAAGRTQQARQELLDRTQALYEKEATA